MSLPFLNYGGVVADTVEAERALLAAAVVEARRSGAAYLELRHTQQKFPDLASRRHKVAMLLDLQPTVDAQWHMLDRKVRNQVRKAEKNGLTVRTGGVNCGHPFNSVFARNNARPCLHRSYSRTFFEETSGRFRPNTPDRLRVPRHSTGGGIPRCTGRRRNRGALASASKEFHSLSANTLLYWEMLRFSIERGFRPFDFGRSTRDAGTFHFKRQWGPSRTTSCGSTVQPRTRSHRT